METIAQDNLKEIFHFLGFSYFPLLKQVNKEWKRIIENEIKIENTNTQKYFYSLVNDFVSREDFEELEDIQFIFQDDDLFAKFSYFGLLNSVKYLHEKNPITEKVIMKNNQKIKWNKSSCASAIINGHLDILKYLHENKCPWDKWSCANASFFGHLNILKYLHKNGCPWDEWSCEDASLSGHLYILKYLHENKCPWDKKSCANAAFGGHFKCLKYLHENKCPWDERCCANAARNGYLYVLKYLHKNNCPWDKKSCAYASEKGHLYILKYLHENKCPYDKKQCLNFAKNNEIREYIEKFM